MKNTVTSRRNFETPTEEDEGKKTVVQSFLVIDADLLGYCINPYYQVLFIIIAIVMSVIACAYTRITPVRVWKIIRGTSNYI
jgi:hypothetical protein